MAIPIFWEFFKPIMNALENGNVLTMEEIEKIIVPSMNLSGDEIKEMTAGGTRTKVKDRIYWGRSYLKQAGLIRFPKRGSSQITDEGKRVLGENPPQLDINYLKKYESFRKFIGLDFSNNGGTVKTKESFAILQSSQTPQDLMDTAFSEINSALRSEILNALTGGETEDVSKEQANFFEKLVVKLLMKMGYGGALAGEGVVTKSTGDGGVDGIIREDKLGFSNIYIQAKCYSLNKKISRPAVQTFVGATARKDGKALFITTAEFTQDAKDYARDNNVVLVDGKKLADLMIEYDVGVSTVQTYNIKNIDSDFFEEK